MPLPQKVTEIPEIQAAFEKINAEIQQRREEEEKYCTESKPADNASVQKQQRLNRAYSTK